jgi:hypothetical protein
MSQSYDNYLIHWGKKGMKWGVRHDRASSGKKKQKSKYSQADYDAYMKRKKEQILRDPALLSKHYDKFSKAEIDAAKKRMQDQNFLRTARRQRIEEPGKVALSLLGYGMIIDKAADRFGKAKSITTAASTSSAARKTAVKYTSKLAEVIDKHGGKIALGVGAAVLATAAYKYFTSDEYKAAKYAANNTYDEEVTDNETE